jgi:hypothetical protein
LKIETGISNAGLFLLIIIILAVSTAYFLYRYKKDNDEFLPFQRNFLLVVRLLYSFILLFLLLSPLIERVKNRPEKPILVVGFDNSASMATDEPNQDRAETLLANLNQEIGNKFNIQTFTFGEKVTQNNTPDYTERISNYTQFFDEISNRYYNLNVGAVVLLGDGIYNQGRNPSQVISNFKTPVYTLGLGDTITESDQALINISHNENVFLGNSFPIEIEATFSDVNISTSQLNVYLQDKLVYSETISIPQSDFYYKQTISVKAEKTGLQNISVVLTPFENEKNTLNNRSRFSIEVHDNKYQVLFLSQGPHPDIGALSLTLAKQANFSVSIVNPQLSMPDLTRFDLIVLNQLPSLEMQQSDVFSKINSLGKPLLIIIGPNTSLSALNNMNLGFSMVPTTVTQESFPYFNKSFEQFNLPEYIQNVSSSYPPLLTYFTKHELSSNYSALANQKINGIEMNYPLISTGVNNNRKVGIIHGEGIWRWRMVEYQNFENQENFDQLFTSLFNYLCLQETREQFRLQYNRINAETNPVKFKAQVYNELFEPITQSEIKLVLSDSTNAEMTYIFDANQLDYNLNMGFLKPGTYSFIASTTISDNEFSKSGNFVVQEINIENNNLKADFKLLNTISDKTNGKFYYAAEFKDMIQEISTNTTIKIKNHKEKSIIVLVDLKWYLFFILLLLSLEWFLRKFWGSY